MNAIVVLNGEPPCPERLRYLAATSPVYAADGGSLSCLNAGVRPVWVAGDMDSVPRSRLPADWEIRHYPEQTRTDFQKVMGDIPPGVKEVRVLGGLGRRVDHLISNLMIATAFDPSLKLTFENNEEQLVRVTSRASFEKRLTVGLDLSLLPLPEAKGVRTQGLRWNLSHADMRAGGQLGQSNEVIGPVSVELDAGCLYVWTLIPMTNDH